MATDPLQEFKRLAYKMGATVHSIARQSDMELLGGPQGHVLHYLIHHEKEEVFIKDIEQHLQISKSVASNLIKRMEKNGFVVVKPSKVDKRKKIVRMSKVAQEKSQKMDLFWGDLRQQLVAGITEEELAVFSEVVQKMYVNLEKMEQRNKK